jgi:hypothetical protein
VWKLRWQIGGGALWLGCLSTSKSEKFPQLISQLVEFAAQVMFAS